MQKYLTPASFYTILVILCVTLFGLPSCESRRTIVNGLEEKDANEILVFLGSRHIDATKIPSREGQGAGAAKTFLWDISVDSSQASEAMALLNAAGLPRRRGQSLLNLFSSGGLVPSEMQDKIRYQAGLAEQIASTIRKIDGVLDADVQLSFPEEDPLNPAAVKGHPSASVYIKHQGVLDDPNSHLITKIKRLVASSVTGLDFDDVTVIGDRARFSELPTTSAFGEEKPEQVKVWSMTISKESLQRFQLLFLAFSSLIVLLLLLVLWVMWKSYPLLAKRGGFRSLFKFKPIPDETKKPEATPTEKPPEGEKPPGTDTSQQPPKA